MVSIPRFTSLLLTATLSFFISDASADESPSMLVDGGLAALLFPVDHVDLEVSDQVKDQCMPRPGAIEQSAEAALRRNGISVVGDEHVSFNTVIITANGYELSSSRCVVNLHSRLKVFRVVSVPGAQDLEEDMKTTIAPVLFLVSNGLLSGPKSNMQDRLERLVEQDMNKLFIELDQAQEAVRAKWPSVWSAVYE